MRFTADGPSIPDDLLLARDQGRVIFFCGAGVSRAKANLPDFFGLAKTVNSTLGVALDSAAHKLIEASQYVDENIGVSGLISADRIFGLLERDFRPRDIEAAVAAALKPTPNCDLSPHQILLDLATTPEGIVRLVTTNFDRLFDDCGRNLPTWHPPRLPDPSRPAELNGIVYLHGRANLTYDGAEGDGFVLSSSEFGRAYLSDGWATSFFRDIIRQHVVVFVGYTADDPPVQYLLEALNKSIGRLNNVYAFQSGGLNDATARWRHKGVHAIAYDPANRHAALWKTLEAWAERARDQEQWYSDVICLAKNGPDKLAPHQRGQVAHIVSTYEGAKKFSHGDDPPSAEWLCVLDAKVRYSKPGHSPESPQRGPYVDPFDFYGLDSDVPPPKIDPDDHLPKRETPAGAWNGFALNTLDLNDLRPDNLPALSGRYATSNPRLPRRLAQLGIWIVKVSHQPATIWWAAQQAPLHPEIQERVRWELEKGTHISTPSIRYAWSFLLETWRRPQPHFARDLYGLKDIIDKDGWSTATLREYAELTRPHLTVSSPYWGGPMPPKSGADLTIQDLLSRDVDYPKPYDALDIPDEWVWAATKALRKNLELALELETEIGGYGLDLISPIVPEESRAESHQRSHGLSELVIRFSKLFSRLIQLDVTKAKRELVAWPLPDDQIFAKLRIWAASKEALFLPEEALNLFASLSIDSFWDSRHQRDLLLALAARWPDSEEAARKAVEDRLLQGPARWHGEQQADFEERRAHSTLNRLHWLSRRGCTFSFNLAEITETLRAIATKWALQYADGAADSLESRSGWVTTDTDHTALTNEPLASILTQAKALSGRHRDFLTENDPYAGLATSRPNRAFSALTLSAKKGEFPEWAWRTFLNSGARENDKPRLMALIAERLNTYPNSDLSKLVGSIATWLHRISTTIARCYARTFERLVRKLTCILSTHPPAGSSMVIRGRSNPDWPTESLNAPAGNLAQALLNDPRKDALTAGQGFPREWLGCFEDLLALPGDMQRHAIVIACYNLNWFYTIDPSWTESHLLTLLADPGNQDAAWAGFLWGGRLPTPKLYARLKSALLALAIQPLPSGRDYSEVIAGITLVGWGKIDEETGIRRVSSDELRHLLLNADEEFRSRILWLAEQWANAAHEGTVNKWPELLLELLQSVWPRQISAKSPSISARLCDLAFSNLEQFPKLVDAILPLLTKIERDHISLPNLRKAKDSIVDRYPTQTLALLDAVLPDDATAWPYGIESVLELIEESDLTLSRDERLISLKRRWNAR